MNLRNGRILIYRLGSLGDTMVALPAFHLVAEAFPEAERWVLTQVNDDPEAASLPRILAGSELVHGCIQYPLRTRSAREFLRLRRKIRSLAPDALIYLAEPRGLLKTVRDAAFFRWCGIRRLVGLPYSRNLRLRRRLKDGSFEFEGSRLLRCVRTLGDADIDADGAFDLGLTENERTTARVALGPLSLTAPILAVSIGARVDVKDWGDTNWSALLHRLQSPLSGWSLVMVGAGVERDRSDRLLASWQGPGLNLCGTLSVRESAAVLEAARLFVGHDSGPMHLAAAVGTTCVAIFSSRNLPGEWFPHGRQHHVLYTDVACGGCGLDTCPQYGKVCIASIRVDDVVREVESVLGVETRTVGRPETSGG